jgi:cytochrome c-type biogenesis protein CcmH
MLMLRAFFLALFLLLPIAPLSLQAGPVDTLAFPDQATEDRFHALIGEIRCIKCQNTSIAGSNADLARDHRNKVYELMMERGMSDDEIKDWFLARYGDFVLYKPKVDERTWLLWGLPVVLIGLGLILLVVQLRKRSRPNLMTSSSVSGAPSGLSAVEQERLRDLLKDE